MSNLVLIPENILAFSGISVVAASEASASMAGDNLLNETPSQFWRSTSNAPGSTALHIGSDVRAFGVNAVALIGHNLYRGDQYRIFVYESAGSVADPLGYVGYNPTSLIAGETSNATGTYTAVDEGETPDASWMTPTAIGSAWSAGFGFATPTDTPKVGADIQAFWVYVKTQTAPPNLTPTVTCSLYESGTLKATLGTRTIGSTTGQWMCFPWNASSLTTASGVNVECRCEFTALAGSQYASLGSVVWTADSRTRTGDSGWLTYDPFEGSGITFKPEVQGGGSAIYYRFPSTFNPYLIYIHIRSSRSPLDYVATEEILPPLHGYVQIGCVIAGEAWSPAADRNFGPLISAKDWSSKSRTYGGQRFGSRRFVQRVLSLPMDWLTPEEAHTLFDRILWRHGILKPILVSILPGDATEGKHTTFLASLRNPENAMVATTTRGKSRAMTLEMEEEL